MKDPLHWLLVLGLAAAVPACGEEDEGDDASETESDGDGTDDGGEDGGIESGDQPDSPSDDGGGGDTMPTDGTDEEPAPPPGDFSITGPGALGTDNTPLILWEASSGALSYKLAITTDSDCKDIVYAAVDIKDARFTVATELDDGTYYACVTAVNDTGDQKDAKNKGFAFVIDTTGPADLDALSASEGAAIGTVRVSLDLPDDRDDYDHIEVVAAVGTTPPTDCASGALVGNVTSLSDNVTLNLSTGLVTMSYRACIYDEAGNVTGSKTATAAAKDHHSIFVTTEKFDGNLKADYFGKSFETGLEGADYRCKVAAFFTGNWKAIISSSTEDAKDRLSFEGPIYNFASTPVELRADGGTIFDGAGIPLSGADYDTNGNASSESVTWTDVNATGGVHIGVNCNEWTSGDSGDSGWFGNAASITTGWLTGGTATCQQEKHLYCIDQLPEN